MTSSSRQHPLAMAVSVAALLLTQVGLVGWSGWRHSPVYNEAGHLSSGLSHLYLGRFDLFRVNPPLVRTIAALPLAFASASVNWSHYDADPQNRQEYVVALDFLQANGNQSFWLVTIARWACIPFVVLGGCVSFLWAKDLYGAPSGVFALALWCFSPTILGHASLLTPDAHAASMGLAAGYAFWSWLRRPWWSQAMIVGLTLGLAELCKFTLLVFYPVGLLLWLAYRTQDRVGTTLRDWLRQAGMLATILLISLLTINAGYVFEGSFKRLGDYRFQSRFLAGAASENGTTTVHNRFLGAWVESLPVPLPQNYVQGIDTQKLDFERGLPSYLAGCWSDHGWWYYYLYALAVKMPLGTWLLLAMACLAAAIRKTNRSLRRDEIVVLGGFLAIFVFVSSQTGFSAHFRYIIPSLPFLFVWISQVARVFCRPDASQCISEHAAEFRQEDAAGSCQIATARRNFITSRLGLKLLLLCTGQGLVILALGWSMASSLSLYPHSLSYFNELAAVLPTPADPSELQPMASNEDLGILAKVRSVITAGPRNGPRHLLGSNVAWGQDLLYLRQWRDAHPEAFPLYLVYFGQVDPRMAGIVFTPPHDDAGPLPGWYAIDVNHLYGADLQAADGEGHWRSFEQGQFRWFRQLRPVAMAGYSIYIFHVTLDEANRARKARGFAALRTESNSDVAISTNGQSNLTIAELKCRQGGKAFH